MADAGPEHAYHRHPAVAEAESGLDPDVAGNGGLVRDTDSALGRSANRMMAPALIAARPIATNIGVGLW